jgi:AcrR family transcriptional regulator
MGMAMKEQSEDPRLEGLMQSAHSLFWKYGFRKVSIEEICREAGVSKMTFYKHFRNKLAIAKAVFDRAVTRGLLDFRAILEEDSPVSVKMKKLLQMKLEGVHDISREFLNDFYGNPELGLKAHIDQKTKEVWLEMLEDWKKAQQKGIFRPDLNLAFYFYVARKQAELLHDPYVQSLFPDSESLVMELTRLNVYGIVPRDDA